MPIIRMKTAANPYSPLAWTTSVAVLALEKLRKTKQIREDELDALDAVAEQLDLFYRASEIDLSDKESDEEEVSLQDEPRLRNSFFALRAIKGENATGPIKPPQFKKAGEDIHAIHSIYSKSRNPELLSKEALDNAQELCLELLEHLNKPRPHPSIR